MQEEYENFVLGKFVPSQLHIKINALKSSVGEQEYSAIEFHEAWHFYQTCMTGYGQKLWNMYRQTTGYIFDEWVELVNKSNNEARIPFGFVALSDKNLLAKSCLITMTYMASLGIVAARSSVPNHYSYIKDLRIFTYDYNWMINPVINVGGSSYSLQGNDIIEGHAVFLESIYSYMVDNIPITKTLDRSRIPQKYFICLDYFLEKIGEDRVHEFPIICDLAIQCYWNEPVKTEKEWHDTHPAWRFIRIIDELKDGDILLDKNNIENSYEEYYTRILDKCNYEQMHIVFEKVSSFYSGRELLETEKRMFDAINFRKHNMICGANPFVKTGNWIEMKKSFYPSTIYRNGSLEITLSDTDRKNFEKTQVAEGFFLETIAELHMNAFVSQLMGIKHNDCLINQFACGFKYFNIEDGCIYTNTEYKCDGILSNKTCKLPPLEIDVNENMTGCTFEQMFYVQGISLKDIKANFSCQNITLENIEKFI